MAGNGCLTDAFLPPERPAKGFAAEQPAGADKAQGSALIETALIKTDMQNTEYRLTSKIAAMLVASWGTTAVVHTVFQALNEPRKAWRTRLCLPEEFVGQRRAAPYSNRAIDSTCEVLGNMLMTPAPRSR